MHSHFLIIGIILAFWSPTWLLPSKFGFVSENGGYITTNLDQYNTITFVTYPIILENMNDVRKYNITFSSMLSLSNFTKLIIFEEKVQSNYHDKLYKILSKNFGEKRFSFMTNDDQLDQNSQMLLSDFSARAISQIRTKFACYINPNVVVDPFWYDRLTALFKHFFETDSNAHISVTGKRIQIPLSKKEIKEFTSLPSITRKNFFKSLRKLIKSKKSEAKCIKQCESDYLLVTVDPSPFDLRYLPELRLNGGFFSMYLNYMAETKENSFNANEQVPVYYLGSLPDINDKKYIEDSQYNYNIIYNNSYRISNNFELPNSYNGKSFNFKWSEVELNESYLSPFLSKIKCSDIKDIANVTLTSYSTVDYHSFQRDNEAQNNPNNFNFNNDQNEEYKEYGDGDENEIKKQKKKDESDKKKDESDEKDKKKDESDKKKDESDEKDKKKDESDEKDKKKDDDNGKNKIDENELKKQEKKKNNEKEETKEKKKKRGDDDDESIDTKKNENNSKSSKTKNREN